MTDTELYAALRELAADDTLRPKQQQACAVAARIVERKGAVRKALVDLAEAIKEEAGSL